MLLDRVDAAHFLRRVGFGGRADELDLFTGMDSDEAVDFVIDASVNPIGEPAFMSAPFDAEWQRAQAAPGWWIQRMADSTWVGRTPDMPSPLVEQLTLFWHGHFTSSMGEVNDLAKVIEQNLVLRHGCLGDFEALCQEISVGGAMLKYLDNATNIASSPQENFARELMELFTMGVGNYDENDVVAMARAWTGHNTVGWVANLGYEVNDYVFVADDHDYGPKTIFGITRNWDGPETITEIVKGSKANATARFLTQKLFSHFVHADPPTQVIDELAPTFVASGSSIAELLRAILKHPRMWDGTAYRALVKPPIHMGADLIKRSGLPADKPGFHWSLKAAGQQVFHPPNVAGWGENAYWLSATTAWGRQNIVSGIAWEVRQMNPELLADLPGMSGAAAATRLLDQFGIIDPTPTTHANVAAWIDAAPGYALPHEAAVVAGLTPEFHII